LDSNSLFLNDNALTGVVVPELGRLKKLEHLNLSNNAFGGSLPAELNHLGHLRSLKINRARGGLGGALPSFSGLSKIEEIELAFNRFNGSIPKDFLKGGPKSGDIRVRLAMNQLEGEVPKELADFHNMVLEIEDNHITGLPDDLCRQAGWMNGETVGLERSCDAILCPVGFWSPTGRASANSGVQCQPCPSNKYFGETVCAKGDLRSNSEVNILDTLFNETGGWYWSHAHTNWTKPGVPICYREGIVCGWRPADMNSGVTEIRLNGYGLEGKIPTDVFQLPLLRRISVSNNKVDLSFEGIEQATKLEILTLTHTNIRSLVGIEKAPKSLYNIDVARSKLAGAFPLELLQLSTLLSIQLDDNRLTGPIVSGISRLTQLSVLSLGNNEFSGTIPSEIAHLKELKELHVNDNRLSGVLPTELEYLPLLQRLSVANQKSKNKLSGSVLPFSSAASLKYLNISSNAITGAVPPTILSAAGKNGPIVIDLSSNELVGGVPVELDAFQQLSINLGGNRIEDLPSEICGNIEWMGGITGVVVAERRCDSILCKPGTFTETGRQMHRDDPCVKCASEDEAPFFGAIECVDPTKYREREGKRILF